MTLSNLARFRVAAALIILVGLAAPFAAQAQKASKVHRIGLLMPGYGPNLPAFYDQLKLLGYQEGENLVIERRNAEGQEERLPALAGELVQLKPDLIVAMGPSATRAAHKATTTIPIVMGTVDPVEQGLIASLARPGGNITGWTLLSADQGMKQLGLLKEAIPRLSRVGVIANPHLPGHSARMERLVQSAKAIGLAVHPVEVGNADALVPAFNAMVQARVEAFLVQPEPVVIDPIGPRISALAAQHRLPAMYQWKRYVDQGGLMSYGPSLPEMMRLWADYAHKVLRGANPAELPVETPRKYELILNLRTAKALGLTFPPSFLVMADHVIE